MSTKDQLLEELEKRRQLLKKLRRDYSIVKKQIAILETRMVEEPNIDLLPTLEREKMIANLEKKMLKNDIHFNKQSIIDINYRLNYCLI